MCLPECVSYDINVFCFNLFSGLFSFLFDSSCSVSTFVLSWYSNLKKKMNSLTNTPKINGV